MKTTTKRILLISLCMMLSGGILAALGWALGGFPGVTINSRGIHSINRHEEPYQLEKTALKEFENLNIHIDSLADIRILPSDDDSFYLQYCLNGEYDKPEYTIKDHTLTFIQKDNGNGIFNIGAIGFFTVGSQSTEDDFQLTLYVPQKHAFGNISIYNDYGNTAISNVACDSLKLTLNSGDLDLNSVDAPSFTLSNEYGDVNIQEFCSDTAQIDLESGDFQMDTAEITSLTLTSEYGNVTLNKFSGNTAELKLDSGSLKFDAAELAHLTCENEYGNILILLPKKLDTYTIRAETEYGQIRLPSDAPYSYYSSDDFEAFYRTEGTTDKTLTLNAESGDIELQIR